VVPHIGSRAPVELRNSDGTWVGVLVELALTMVVVLVMVEELLKTKRHVADRVKSVES